MPNQLLSGTSSTGSESLALSKALLFEYPVPWVVRRTFVDIPLERSQSVDGFYKPREVKSAPTSGVEEPPLSDINPHPAAQVETTQVEPSPIILRLADTLDSELQLASAGCPTVGSQGHMEGKCKPCAFYWRPEGCQNGFNCNFCHLCGPGARKRRKKERRHLNVSAMTLLRRNLGCT